MPENRFPPLTSRPRLLSDILENPLSDSAIPAEYSTYQSFSSSPSQPQNHHQPGQSGLGQSHSRSYQQTQAAQDSALTVARGPGVIGQPQLRTSSLSQVTRLQPFTPNPQMSHRYNENRRSAPNLLPALTTSSAVFDAGSPCHPRFLSFDRSFSHTTLNARRYPSRPRTPTPSHVSRARETAMSLPNSPKSRPATPHPYGKPSVKHLTCFWWKVKGDCRFSEIDCLYAHHDTGLLADAPRQVTPGEPAKAGRHLEKALEHLRSKRNNSSSSLNAPMVANPATPDSQGTPNRTATPAGIEALQERLSFLQSDNNFLRSLVEQSSKEKSILMTTIEGLQKEISNLNKDVEFLKDVVDDLQQHRRQFPGAKPSGSICAEATKDLPQEAETADKSKPT